MLGFNENEMQEAEKLADLFDRLRKYAREKNIHVITATTGVQSVPDVTDLTITWEHSQRPKVLDYINLVRTKERPVAANLRLADNAWDFTMPIGYSPLRDGVRQEMKGDEPPPGTEDWIIPMPPVGEVVESLESVLASQAEYDADPDKSKYAHRFDPVVVGDLHNMDVLRTYPLGPPQHDHMYGGPVVVGGRRPGLNSNGRMALLMAVLGVAAAEMPRTEDKIPGLDADFDGQVDLGSAMKRYTSRRPSSFGFGFGGNAADTAVSGAEKRQWSDRKPNGKRKKSWER